MIAANHLPGKQLKKAILAAAASIILLAGCGSESPAPSDPDVSPAGAEISTSSPSPSGTKEPDRSTRGNLIKEIGQPGAVLTADREKVVDFVVTDIEPEPVCDGESPSPSENGHLIAITMEIATAPGISEDPRDYFYPGAWKAIADKDRKSTRLNSSHWE